MKKFLNDVKKERNMYVTIHREIKMIYLFEKINATSASARMNAFLWVNLLFPMLLREWDKRSTPRQRFVSLLQLRRKFEGFTTTHFIENTLGCIEFFTRSEGNSSASADDRAEVGHDKTQEYLYARARSLTENSFTLDINIIVKWNRAKWDYFRNSINAKDFIPGQRSCWRHGCP